VAVDSNTKLIHTAVVTPANVADATVLPELLHGEETKVLGRPGVLRAERGDSGICTASARLYPTTLSI